MLLSESLAWALENYDCSGIRVYCDKDIAKEVADSFMEELNQLWEEAVESVEEEFGGCDEADVPVFIAYTDYGFFMYVSQLEIPYSFGDFYDIDYGPDAFNTAFTNMKENYPQIEFDGLVFYPLCDTRCGEIVQHELSSHGNVETYDFIGREIAALLADDEALEESFATELENYLDFNDTIKTLFAYKDYIQEDILDNALDVILNVAEENDEDREELEDLIEQLKSGTYEEVEEDYDEYDNLPDGYMEALEMFMKAEELGAPKPKARQVVTSDGTFDLVIAKAEEGDAESKFIAGKYFIADHIENEIPRAIRWIQEAADEGIEEAEEYINNHSDSFD